VRTTRLKTELIYRRLPSEEDRGSFQDLPLEFQLGDLAPQARQLHPLIGTECGRPIGSLAALGGPSCAASRG
jgi:hypothetical protein